MRSSVGEREKWGVGDSYLQPFQYLSDFSKMKKCLISIEINVFILLSRVAKKLSPMIPSRSFTVLGLTLHSVIHLNQVCEV